MNWSAQDHQYMALALQLAKKGQYTARPNPMVGCVIVKEEQIIGQGWHESFGQAHAEINALKQASDQAAEKVKGSTCYVTLEPCSHIGKTGACAKALIEAGVSKVIAAMQDPNPQVSGKGFEILENAGIETRSGLLEQQAKELNKGFISRFEKNKPWVTVKLAMSLDGRTALADGSSKWVTGSAARLDVQKLRARQDAIITGIGTLLADNPSLTVRGDGQQDWFSELKNFNQPTRILLDRNGKAKLTHKVFNSDADVWWVKSKIEADEKTDNFSQYPHVEIIEETSLEHLINQCANKGMNNLLVEAGHKLAGQFLQQQIVDELIIYQAPKLMGNNAVGLFDLNVENMSECPELILKDVRQFGDDMRLIYHPKNASE